MYDLCSFYCILFTFITLENLLEIYSMEGPNGPKIGKSNFILISTNRALEISENNINQSYLVVVPLFELTIRSIVN